MSDKQKNTLIPELRFPEFMDSGEWVEKKLGEVGVFVGGGTPSTNNNEYWDGDIQWYTPTEIKNGTLKPSIRTITKKGLENSSAKLLPKGAILITTRATIGDAAITNKECATNQGFQSLIVKNTESNLFWYYWIIFNKRELERKASGSTFKEIGKNEIRTIKTFSPTPQEQQKIAAFLSNLDELKEAHKQKLEWLKQHKKGLMQNLFPQEGEKVPKWRFPEFRDSGEWEFYNGNELFDTISNKNHNSDLPVLAITQDKGAIPRDMIDYTVIASKQSINNYKLVEIGDFIISLRSFQGGIEYSNYKGICSPAYIILRKKVELENLFLKYYFKTPLYIRLLNKNLEGIRDGKMVSYKQFSEIKLPFPSIPEQQKIASCLSSIDEIITAEAEMIEQLEKHKKGLMQGLFPIEN